MTLGGWIFVAVVVGLVVGAIVIYNRLVGLRQRAGEAWSDIDVQLKGSRRSRWRWRRTS